MIILIFHFHQKYKCNFCYQINQLMWFGCGTYRDFNAIAVNWTALVGYKGTEMNTVSDLNLSQWWQKCHPPPPLPPPLLTSNFHMSLSFSVITPALLLPSEADIVEPVSMTTVTGWSRSHWQGRSPRNLTCIPPLFDFQYFFTEDQLSCCTKATVGSAPTEPRFKQSPHPTPHTPNEVKGEKDKTVSTKSPRVSLERWLRPKKKSITYQNYIIIFI